MHGRYKELQARLRLGRKAGGLSLLVEIAPGQHVAALEAATIRGHTRCVDLLLENLDED